MPASPEAAVATLTVRGTPVPALGFGTWKLQGDACADAVADALALGYRHLDTAQLYENEEDVARGMRRAAVPREEVFLVTKVHPSRFTYGAFVRSAEDSLRRLGTDYLDLLLLHWANPGVPLDETLSAAGDVKDRGLARQVGVSNFTAPMVEEARRHADVFCNQVEYHPFRPQETCIAQARRHDLLLTAYTPFADGRVHRDPTLRQIGERHGKTAAQVALRWILQQGVATIPKAATAAHRAANFDVFDFALTEAEMEAIRLGE
jgi:diketogulonate reductase-like aldo/keto reductase